MDKGSELYDEGDYDAAARYYHEALESFIDEKDDQGQADALLEMGNIYGILEDFATAKLYYMECLILYQRNQDLLGEGYALFGLALISEKEGEHEESVIKSPFRSSRNWRIREELTQF